MASKIQTVEAYLNARTANEIGKCLTLVTDDVVMVSSRDGTFKGREQFEKYLKKTQPSGTFQEPVLNGDEVDVVGTVKLIGFEVGVKAHFKFEDEQISKIVLTKSK